MSGFNEGIEAAANEVLRWHKESNIHAPWIGGLAEAIRALKRPEPSGETPLGICDTLREALEMMVEMVEMNGWGRDYAMDVARAALKAMEQGQ